jgi:hypothetical protein
MPEQLKRQIGYKRPVPKKSDIEPGPPPAAPAPSKSFTRAVAESSPEWEEAVAPAKKEPVKAENKPDLSKHVIKWMETHPYFKWTKLCIDVGVDPGNFKRCMNAKNPVIKPDILKKMIKILVNYGFQV